jgi:nicotinate dehydrogenase subunit B
MSESNADRSLLPRREFLKTAAVVVVGFSMAGRTRAQTQPFGAGAVRRGVVAGPPARDEIDSYIAIHPDNTATIYTGYVDLGQGGPTAILQVAAEELDLRFDQVNAARVDTSMSTEGLTLAARTAGIGCTETRAAAAEARRALLAVAAAELMEPVESLTVAAGVVSVRSDPRRSVTYAELVGGRSFDRKFEQVTYEGGIELPRERTDNAAPKDRDTYRIVGTRVPRPDIADKVRGTHEYVQHVRLPGMLHGRVVWPRGQGAHGLSNPTVAGIDESSVVDIPGVQIVRRNNFVGVVAEREWDAVRAARQLDVTWKPFAAVLPGHEGLFESFRAAETDDLIDTDIGNVEAALPHAAHVVSATYRGPYQSHGTMAPNCAVADVTADAALVMCSDQAIYSTRTGVARLLGLAVEQVRVRYYEGSNTYGSSCYRDAALAAAILSQEVGRPVRLQLSREDELGWDNYGPALLSEIRAGIDADARLVALDYQAWVGSAGGSSTTEQLARGAPPVRDGVYVVGGPGVDGPGGGGLFSVHPSHTNMYDPPNHRIVNHRVVNHGNLRVGALRAPMDPSAFFALEGVMDELAFAAKVDPYEFRRRNISHERWLGVLEAAAESAGWQSRVAASRLSNASVVTGRGIGVGTHHMVQNQGDRVTYAAAVVDIEVNKDTGKVAVKHIYGAMDCGLAINPGIVESQMVGMSVHGVSLALHEEVQFSETNVTSLDWGSYQTLRFADHPTVTVTVVQQLHEQSSGGGEELMPAVVAAIGNALFDATGVRVRRYPLTPRRVLAALERQPAAGSAA